MLRNIYIEYYIIKSDGIGTKIIDKLTEKPKKGRGKGFIRWNGRKKIKRGCFDELKAAGGEVAVFFPPFVPFYPRSIIGIIGKYV